tara:strand:+ start:1137 stop:2099 length:963 start_codon:yes stop_codon:yes gene_type:complete
MRLESNNSVAPIFAWIILAVSILAVSSAGAVFQMITSVPPLLKASWRLQATSVILLPFAIFQYKNLDLKTKKLTFDKKNIAIIIGSGLCLWLHFGSWVWSLDHTTLPRSLLFVTSHPLVIVLGLWLINKPVKKESSIGAIIGFIGAAIIILGVESEGKASLIGDLAAFIGAVTVVGYFTAGRVLREWMPLFVYAFPVTFLASMLLAISSILQEGANFDSSNSILYVFGWLNAVWFPYIAYLAIGPGLIGHTGINGVLKWFSPLIISVCLVMEPLIGSIIGYFFVSTETPGMETLIGGAILIIGTLMVTTSQHESLVLESE